LPQRSLRYAGVGGEPGEDAQAGRVLPPTNVFQVSEYLLDFGFCLTSTVADFGLCQCGSFASHAPELMVDPVPRVVARNLHEPVLQLGIATAVKRA
jgi:hypothetical protein